MPYPNSSVPGSLCLESSPKPIKTNQISKTIKTKDSIPKLAHKMKSHIPAWFLTSWQRGSSWVCAWLPNSHHAAIGGVPGGPQTCFGKLLLDMESVLLFYLPSTSLIACFSQSCLWNMEEDVAKSNIWICTNGALPAFRCLIRTRTKRHAETPNLF